MIARTCVHRHEYSCRTESKFQVERKKGVTGRDLSGAAPGQDGTCRGWDDTTRVPSQMVLCSVLGSVVTGYGKVRERSAGRYTVTEGNKLCVTQSLPRHSSSRPFPSSFPYNRALP